MVADWMSILPNKLKHYSKTKHERNITDLCRSLNAIKNSTLYACFIANVQWFLDYSSCFKGRKHRAAKGPKKDEQNKNVTNGKIIYYTL